RFRSATQSVIAWRHLTQRCMFVCMDAFKFLASCRDEDGLAIYSDAPWPDDGDCYRHTFGLDEHRRLATKLASYRKTRVVIRFGVHPLIEQLYPRNIWNWSEQVSRSQGNNAVHEA